MIDDDLKGLGGGGWRGERAKTCSCSYLVSPYSSSVGGWSVFALVCKIGYATVWGEGVDVSIDVLSGHDYCVD